MIIDDLLRKVKSRGLQYWLPVYIKQQLIDKERIECDVPRHILFCFVDHFEPANRDGGNLTPDERVKAWVERYPQMVSLHRDADGRHPQHTWFYPPHLDHHYLNDLVKLCMKEYGDVEMHLHHNRMPPFPDTSETLKAKILKCIDDYSRYGVFCLPDGSRRFAFIHGDWSLDNALGPEVCGVNNEISILKECGCYADFTFPSLGIAQPETINSIYYCKDDPDKPKSYNHGYPLKVGGKPRDELLIIQGIIGLRWASRTHVFRPSIEASHIDKSDYPFNSRIDYWIRNAIRIPGRPEWLFVKIHTHGARDIDFEFLLGTYADQMYTYLETNYNNGINYILHYVSAREMYNIAKAAEDGKTDNPNLYRDYIIPPYLYR